MDDGDRVADDALFARLAQMWQQIDPEPADLADRMIAALAVEELSREYALLTLVEASTSDAVRSESDSETLQFSDGRTSVLLHVTAREDGSRRIDGWVHADTLALRLVQDARDWAAQPGEHGRFAFDTVPRGASRLRIVVRARDGSVHEVETPPFDV